MKQSVSKTNWKHVSHQPFFVAKVYIRIHSLKLTAKAPENGAFPIGISFGKRSIFRGELLVLGRVPFLSSLGWFLFENKLRSHTKDSPLVCYFSKNATISLTV